MDKGKKLDPVVVSSSIFLEDKWAKTTVESILAKVCPLVYSIEESFMFGELAIITIAQLVLARHEKVRHPLCLLLRLNCIFFLIYQDDHYWDVYASTFV